MCSSVLVSFLEIFYLYFTVVSSHSIYINESISKTPRQVDNGCVLPPYPHFGQWSIYQTSSQLKTAQLRPGTSVPSGTILQVSCQNEYKLEGDTAVVCLNAEWTSNAGPCLKKCPPLHSTSRMTVTCTFNDGRKENCEEATDSTRAHFVCADFYEDQGLDRQPYSVCFYGKWSRKSPPECVPICGQKTSKKRPTLIIGGVNATRGEYPWQIALYDIATKNLLCGGSLLNQRVVLTAAHCVTDENGKLLPKQLFMVVAGKYFRNYSDPRDSKAQFSPIYNMEIPKNYKGEIQNYFGDIAVIITKKAFILSTSVQPVCVDWTFKYSSLLDPVKTINGYVSGWGYTTENDKPSDVLKELQVPLIRNDRCNQELPEDDRRYMTDDKLCAGYLHSGTSVCGGDSGGGLVTKHGSRYYLIGIVSLSPQAPTAVGGCDSQQYALYTNISYYTETFILGEEARFRPSMFGDVDCEDDPNCKAITTVEATTTVTSVSTTARPIIQTSGENCVLPQHPKLGQWKIFGAGANLSPGMSVSSGTILQMSCNEGYKLVGQDINLCQNGEWSSKNVECFNGAEFQIQNKETRDVWIGIQGNPGHPHLEEGGFVVKPGQTVSIQAPKNWAGHLWPRTYCNPSNNHCDTGDCGNKLKCNGAGVAPPMTLVEITLKGHAGLDFYSISLLEGFNLRASIQPLGGISDGGPYSCKKIACLAYLSDHCSKELQLKNWNGSIACNSACNAFNTDQYCCRGAYGTPGTCKPSDWPVNYPKYFKDNCPDAYSYAYDDHMSTFTCKAETYLIIFGE